MHKPLHIAVGIEIFYPEINGIITATMNLLHALQKLGHKPFIITPCVHDSDNRSDFEIVQNIPVYYIPSKPLKIFGVKREIHPGLRQINKRLGKNMVISLFKKNQCDVVHTTAPGLTCKAMLKAAKSLSIPCVQTFHTNVYDEEYIRYIIPYGAMYLMPLVKLVVWAMLAQHARLSDVITAPSFNTCHILKKKFSNSTIMHIPNGIDVEPWQQEDASLLAKFAPEALEYKGRYGLFIGRMGKEKSIDILLQAIRHVVLSIPDFMFFLIGDGPLIDTYRSLADTLHITKNVRFLGKISSTDIKKSGILKQARFFSTASLTEVQSMTVIESICSKTPQVLAEHSSMTTLAKDAAIYAKPGDPISLGNAMHTMLTNDTTYHACKRAITAMGISFDGTEVAKKFLMLYESLCVL